LCIEQLPPEQLDKLTRHFDGFTLPMDDAEKRRYMKAAQAFHGQGIFLSNNSFIIAYDRGFDFIMKSYQKGLIREPEKTLAEHQEIIWAIRKRDAQQAPELLIRHNLRTRPFIDERYPKSRPTDDD
jgi:DNA-binding GntR family transcriptional regulator